MAGSDLTSTRRDFRGFILPWQQLSRDDAATSVTQAGPLPGVPVAPSGSELALVASGDVDAGATHTIRVQRPGSPDGSDEGLGLVWCHDNTEDCRGWDVPATITSWRVIDEVAAGAVIQPEFPALLTLASGKVLCFSGADNTGTSKDIVQCAEINKTTGAVSAAVTVFTAAGNYPANVHAHPAPVQLPSGRVLVFYFVYSETTIWGLTEEQIMIFMSYSDDEGATWTTGSRTCAPYQMNHNAAGSGTDGYDATRGMVAYYHPTGIGLWYCIRRANTNLGLEYPREVLVQCASATLGANFREIVTADYTNGDHADYLGCAPAATVANGVIHLGWARYSLSVGTLPKGAFPGVVQLGSVWEPYVGRTRLVAKPDASTAAAAWYIASAVSGGEAEAWDMTMTTDDAGIPYVIIRQPNADSAISTARYNATQGVWESLGRGSAGAWGWCVVDSGNTAYPWRLSATWQRGRMLIAHQSDAVAATVGASIGMFVLGGWTTVCRTLATDVAGYASVYRVTLSRCWIPIELPDNTAEWAAAGAGTATLDGSGLNISTAVQAKTYTYAVSGTVAEGMTVEVEVAPVTSAVITEAVVLTVIIADGVEEYRVTARIGTAAVDFYDDHNTAGVGALIDSVTIDTTGGVCILLDMSSASMKAWVRARSFSSDREWTEAAQSDTLTDAATYAAPAANGSVVWGHRISTAESNWYRVSWDDDEWLGLHILSQSYPLDLQARHLGTSAVYVDSGLKIAAKDGPGYIAEEFTVATRYSYGIERIEVADYPSPRHSWRSTGTDPGTIVAQQTITWKVDADFTTASRPPGSTIALSVHGANWRTGSIRRRNTAGAYSTIATIDAAAGMTGLAFTRAGSAVYGQAGVVSPPYFHEGECRGWRIELASGEVRQIRDNTEGFFGGATDKRCVLYLSDLDDTEATTGTCAIWPADFAVVVEVDTTAWRAVQLIIDSQYTSAGYIETGTVVVGWFVPFGFEYAWGRVLEHEPAYERAEFRDRTDRVRTAGPVRRVVSLAWSDGVDLTGVTGTAPTASYVRTSATGGAGIAASVPGTPLTLEGILRRHYGARIPLALVMQVDKGDTGADTRTVNRREQGPILCRLTSPIRRESVQGSEDYNEVVRVATITLEELT